MRVAPLLLVAALALTLAAPAAAEFPQHVDATAQPGGTVSETSSTVPKDAESAKIIVKPKAGDTNDFFTDVSSYLAKTPSRKQRVLFCVGFFKIFEDLEDDDEYNFSLTRDNFALLVLAACLQIALERQPTNAGAAASSCPAVPASVPMNVSRSGGGYKITVEGKVKKPDRRRLRVQCRRVNGTMRVKVRPRKRSRSLRSAVGRQLAIGFYNTGDSPVQMRTTFNVK